MNITFLSPITPDDMKRQSLIFSYLDVSVESMDGASHDVQLYTDISAGMFLNQRKLPVNSNRYARVDIWRQDCYCAVGLRRH